MIISKREALPPFFYAIFFILHQSIMIVSMAMSGKKILLYPLLFPLSLLYGLIVSIRNRLFNANILKSRGFDLPIICVGNLTVGGTGKTPLIEYLLQLLSDKFKVAALSRGYKRKTKQFVMAGNNTDICEIGDEAKQIKLKFPHAIVAVDRKRVNGIEQILKEAPDTKAVLLDDALQHRYVKAGYTILLIDYNRPVFKDQLLPLGRLREPVHQKKRSNIIMVTKVPEDIKPIEKRVFMKKLKPYPYQTVFFTCIKYKKHLEPMDEGRERYPLDLINEKTSVLLVTGIANPKPLMNHLKKYTPHIKHLKYPDHHEFKKGDAAKIKNAFGRLNNENKVIVTTEKDAVRMRNFGEIDDIKSHIYFQPIKIKFLDDQKENFNKMILRFVKHGKKKKHI